MAFRLGRLGMEAASSVSDLTLVVRSVLAFKPHLIIIDCNGVEDPRALFQFIYDVSDIPIVVLGDVRRETELVWYLERGASDYVSRTASETILSARISAILRRLDTVEPSGVLRVGSLEIDAERHQVRKAGEPIQLTPTEFRILRVLAENAGKPCGH
ncbi:MAG: response regulator transcription factor, partial [Dehalococcoidia bacterium]